MSTHNNHPDEPDSPDRDRPDQADSNPRYRTDSNRRKRAGSDGQDRTDERVRNRPASDRVRTKSAAPSYPDAHEVGPHLVIDRTEWVPGRHPETHLGHDGQRGYAESFYRCIQCGAERQSKQGFPPECDRGD